MCNNGFWLFLLLKQGYAGLDMNTVVDMMIWEDNMAKYYK